MFDQVVLLSNVFANKNNHQALLMICQLSTDLLTSSREATKNFEKFTY